MTQMSRPPPVAAARLARTVVGAVVVLTAPLATRGADEPPAGAWVAGVTEPYLDATLGSPSGGIVARIHVREGDRVEKGQPIVDFHRELEEIEVERRRIQMETARRDFERTKELFDRTKSVSREELDKREAEHAIAQAEFNLASEMLRRKQVVAPFAGQIIDLYMLEVGEARQEREALARLVDASRCTLLCYLEAAGQHALAPGRPARVRLGEQADSPEVNGEVEFLSPVADPASGLFKLKVVFANPGGVKPGVTACLWVPTAPSKTP